MWGEELDYREAIAQAVELIKGHRGFYALTGAGMSTESGIPDFRTPGTGIWGKIDPITASVEVLHSNPGFYEVGFALCQYNREPNPGTMLAGEEGIPGDW